MQHPRIPCPSLSHSPHANNISNFGFHLGLETRVKCMKSKNIDVTPKSRNIAILLITVLLLTFYSFHKTSENRATLKVSISVGDPQIPTKTPTTFNGAPIACSDLSVTNFGTDAALSLSSINWPLDAFVLRSKNGFDAGLLKKIVPLYLVEGDGCFLELYFGGIKDFSQPLNLISKNGFSWTLTPERLKWKDVVVEGEGASM